jgi:hypothetical protein
LRGKKGTKGGCRRLNFGLTGEREQGVRLWQHHVEEGRGLVWCAHELEEGAQLTTPTEAAFGRAAQGRAHREKVIRRVGRATGRLLGRHGPA